MDPAQAAAFAFAAQFNPPGLSIPFSATTAVVASTDAQPTPAANPTPPHPSYTEMITAAIQWGNSQGKHGGSSKRAISNYIDRVYSNLPPSHSSLFTHHLNRLQSAGQLVMIKNSYQLPSLAALRPPPPSPKQAQTPANGPGSASSGKRPRGRPPRNQQQQQVVVPFVHPVPQVSEVDAGPVYVDPGAAAMNNGQASGQKRRGRPRKQPAAVPGSIAPQKEVVQPVYQRMQVNGSVVMEEFERRRPARGGRRRGRGRGMGRSGREEVLGVAPMSQVVGKKKRGWPKGKPRGKKNMGAGAAPMAAGSVPGGETSPQRQGRKSKGSGKMVVHKERKPYMGKTRGRPRKNASTLGKHVYGQGHKMASEELLRKLQDMVKDMQLRVRDAVGVIRPHLANQNAADAALTALHQLEVLSTMNLTASKTETEPTATTMPMIVTATSQSLSVPESLAPAAPNVSAPWMMTVTAPSGMTLPLPFTVNMPTMATTAPMHAPSGIETQLPMGWIPSSGAQ